MLLRFVGLCNYTRSGLFCQNIPIVSLYSKKRYSLQQNLVDKYQRHGDIIQNVLKQNPSLQQKSASHWEKFINILNSYDIKEVDCFQIISSEPEVLTIPHEELEDVLARWHSCQLGSDLTNLLLLNNPGFLFVPLSTIEKRIPILQSLTKRARALTILLLECPNVLTEDWNIIQQKIDYVVNVMVIDRADIFKSAVLSKSLNHIKIRHTLLLKCGLYEAPSKYVHKQMNNAKSAFQNPPLKRIVDNSDTAFARKICHITLEEYEAYKVCFEKEMDETSDEEALSGSDSDSE